MKIKGSMDGWHGDEMECRGRCGVCEDCEKRISRQADDDYERYCYNNEIY